MTDVAEERPMLRAYVSGVNTTTSTRRASALLAAGPRVRGVWLPNPTAATLCIVFMDHVADGISFCVADAVTPLKQVNVVGAVSLYLILREILCDLLIGVACVFDILDFTSNPLDHLRVRLVPLSKFVVQILPYMRAGVRV